jgi:hypothetical protein
LREDGGLHSHGTGALWVVVLWGTGLPPQSSMNDLGVWVPQTRSRWLDVAVSVSCPLAPTLFYCLLNTALSYDPVGWGVPYASAIVSDTEEPLADISLQVPCRSQSPMPMLPSFRTLSVHGVTYVGR